MTIAGSEVDIAIVGAGLAGAATAYCLRQRGVDVVVMDRESTPGVHSSGRNAAIIREQVDDPGIQPYLSAGAEFMRRQSLARFDQRGLMLLGLGDEDVTSYLPRARGTGWWCPDDGTIDVAGLLQAYLQDASLLTETVVDDWVPHGSGVRILTSRGDVRCRVLVNAAGPWAGQVGHLPLVPMNRHLFVTTPMSWVDPRWPCVWDGPNGLYFRPESGGLLLSCCDESPADPGDYCEDPAVLEDLTQKLDRLQPDLGELAIQNQWVGQRTFASDRRFVVGFDPRDHRLFHVAGLGGHGVTVSYAVGDLAARMILGESGVIVPALQPARLLNPKIAPAIGQVRVT